jgi:hypothetical protein
MYRKKIDVDVINDVLKAVLEAQPHSTFAQSLYQQYQERGGLSKKQLEGLYKKAQQINTIAPNKLATLEAVILKRPNRYKSAPPPPKPLYEKDERAGQMIETILAKSPLHKRVLFFKSKYENNETFSPAEILELERFFKIFQK